MIKYSPAKIGTGHENMKLLSWAILFILLSTGVYAICVTPTNGQTFTTNTDICPGTHTLGSGVTIGASNIYLNCSGATFDGTTPSGNVGITATGRQNVTIKSCRLINYATGIRLTRTHNSSIFNINTTNSINSRIVDLVNSSDNIVRNSNLTHDAGHGVNMNTGSRRNIIRNNFIMGDTAGSGSFPIVIDSNSDNNRIFSNVIRSKSGGNDNVISIQANSDRNIIDHNNISIVSGSGGVKYGIRMDNVDRTNITFNRIIEGASSNNLGSLQVNADNSYIADNFIFTTSTDSYGLLLTSASTGSIVLRNNITTTGGGPNSPAVQLDTNSNNVIIQNNTLSVASTNAHIRLSTILNATMDNNIFRSSGNVAIDVIGTVTYDLIIGSGTNTIRYRNLSTDTDRLGTNGAFIGQRIAGVNSSLSPNLNRSARLSFLGYNPRFTPEIRRISAFRNNLTAVLLGPKCPSSICTAITYQNQVISFNVSSFSTYGISPCTNVTNGMNVTTSILICPGIHNRPAGLKIKASNIIIACNNTATLDGNDVFASPGILINPPFNNITIDGCKFTDFGYGIFLNRTNNNTIVNNTFISNVNSGINGLKTSGNTIIGNNHSIQNFIFMGAGIGEFNTKNRIIRNVVTNNVGSPTIWLTRSKDTLIQNNTVSGTSSSDLINLQNSNNITIIGNRLGPTGAICIEANSTVTNSTIFRNTIRNCGSYGIQLTTTSQFRVENNTIINSDTGVRLFSTSTNHIFRNNVIFNTTTDGITTGQTSNHNKFENNIINKSGNYGIHLDDDTGFNTLNSNRIINSGVNQVFIFKSNKNNITNNVISGVVGTGIVVSDSNDTIASNNNISNPVGFDLIRFVSMDIIGNTMTGPGVGTGVFVGSPSPGTNNDLFVQGNSLTSFIIGMNIDGDTSGVIVRDNLVKNSVARGFNVGLVNGPSYFTNNTVRNAGLGFRLVSLIDAVLSNNTITNTTTAGISFEFTSFDNIVTAPITAFSNNAQDIRTTGTDLNTLILTNANGFVKYTSQLLNITDIQNNLFISNSIIAVNSASEPGLNKASSVRLEVNSCSGNDLFIKSGFTTNVNSILSNGVTCFGGQCTSLSCSGNTLTFNTNGFSSYAWGKSTSQGSILSTLLFSIIFILYVLGIITAITLIIKSGEASWIAIFGVILMIVLIPVLIGILFV